MPLPYSCFISYRRNDGDKKFIDKLKNILQTEAFNATNKKEGFFDTDSIRLGQDFNDKVYEGLENSWFFMAIWYFHYLGEDNLYCAKELYHALQIQNKLKEQIPEDEKLNFYFIIPFVRRGSLSDLPECLSKNLAIEIKNYEHAINSGKQSQSLIDFRHRLYNDLLSYFKTLKKYSGSIDFQELYKTIEKPDDEKLKAWIKAQNKHITDNESKKSPVLIKNDE